MTLHVSVEQSLQVESFATNPADKLAGVRLAADRHHLFPRAQRLGVGWVGRHGVLDPVAAVDDLQWGIRWDPVLNRETKQWVRIGLAVRWTLSGASFNK